MPAWVWRDVRFFFYFFYFYLHQSNSKVSDYSMLYVWEQGHMIRMLPMALHMMYWTCELNLSMPAVSLGTVAVVRLNKLR